MTFYQEIITKIKQKNLTEKQLAKLKRDLALKFKLQKIPTNIQILLEAPAQDFSCLKRKLMTKPTRTLSGVSPIAVMTKPFPCPHGKCTFCPGGIGSPWGDVPQSYTGHEPATLRAKRNNYDPYLTIFNRLEQYVLLGQNFEKAEIIVMSGTFPAMPKSYQEKFVKEIYQALNDFSRLFFASNRRFDYLKFKRFFQLPGPLHDQERIRQVQDRILRLKRKRKAVLEEEQKKNERAIVKCVAFCIETRPDWGFLEQGNQMLRQGCTRVELGIESVYDDVLKHVHRGHTVADAKRSVQTLRDLGFKINFHYMPGLPLTDRTRDIAGMKQLFNDPDYRPDMLKIYPCMVSRGTKLYEEYQRGEFMPLSTEEAARRIVDFKRTVPEYCRIQRIQRDVPTKYWEAGVDRTNLRQYMFENYPVKCRCIRCREPKNRKIDWKKVRMKIQEYAASGGREFFLLVEDTANDILLGFCRLRFPGKFLRSEITKDSALIRELHVYGTATALGEEGKIQHKGWGKKLMKKAEEICQRNGKKKIIVISGVGVRGYYRKLGYRKEGPYMVKIID